jgi:hypothetical protein
MNTRVDWKKGHVLLASTLLAWPAFASPYEMPGTDGLSEQPEVYSPYAERSYPDRVLFGDLHFHTELSFDAGLIGTTLSAHEGYRFARGETVRSNTGQPVQLIRPLDFLAITDHAEMIGLAPAIRTEDPLLLADPWGGDIFDKFNSGIEGRQAALAEIVELATVDGVNPFGSDDLTRSIWGDFVEISDAYNDPGTFTAMAGFEWTFTPLGDNLHRVVLFADGADKTGQTLPLSFFEAPDPALLWEYLERYEADTGGRAIAIPHNANLSNGLMFSDRKFDGSPMDAEYAALRSRWEPLHEMSQSRATRRHTRCCRRMMNLPTSRHGMLQTCPGHQPRNRKCSNSNTQGRRCAPVCGCSRRSGSTPISSG